MPEKTKQRKRRLKSVQFDVDPFNENLLPFRFLDGKRGFLLNECGEVCSVLAFGNDDQEMEIEIPISIIKQDPNEQFKKLKIELFTFCVNNADKDARLQALAREISCAQSIEALESMMIQYREGFGIPTAGPIGKVK